MYVFNRLSDTNKKNKTNSSLQASVNKYNNFHQEIQGNQTQALNDSLNSLNFLSLGNKHKGSSSNFQQVFETKTYGNNLPEIFRNHTHRSVKHSILAPAKLRCAVTQTSWVAGGYWQSGLEPPLSLSRSSSQSSGIGSLSSNQFRSQEPSIPDFDRCSVVTDPYSQPERLKMIPLDRDRNQLNFSPSPSSEYNSVRYVYSNCPGHTTTVIANPAWLPALLCGSLLFNTVVLCTILMR